jgi:hypothetical protein
MEAILRRRGGPMATADLVAATRLLWGDDTVMQPRIWGAMVNVGRGAWGLSGRDLIVPEDALRDLVAHAEASLAAGVDSAVAIHAALPEHLAHLLADDCAMASALHPVGFRLAKGFRLRDARAGDEASPDSIVGKLRTGLRRNPGGLTIDEAYALASEGGGKAPLRHTVERMLAFCARRSTGDATRWVLRDPSAGAPAKPPSVRDPRLSGPRIRMDARGAGTVRGAIWTEEAVATIERMLADGEGVEAIRDALGDGIAIGNLVSKINRLGLAFNTCRVPGRSRRRFSPAAGA